MMGASVTRMELDGHEVTDDFMAIIDTRAFPCPACGATDQWRAEYSQPVHQGVNLWIDPAGLITHGDYHGDEDSYDEPNPNEYYRCAGWKSSTRADATMSYEQCDYILAGARVGADPAKWMAEYMAAYSATL